MSTKSLVRLSIILVFIVIAWGSFVRALGAGLGCGPDWPTCNGEIIPSDLNNLAVFLEYFHRVIGGLATLSIVLMTYMLAKQFGVDSRVFKLGVFTLILVVTQVLLGMVLVKLHLDPIASAIHLSLATIVFGSLVHLNSEVK